MFGYKFDNNGISLVSGYLIAVTKLPILLLSYQLW